jgi:hypothetical protein
MDYRQFIKHTYGIEVDELAESKVSLPKDLPHKAGRLLPRRASARQVGDGSRQLLNCQPFSILLGLIYVQSVYIFD